ncbi:hypothetical protein HDU93_007522 [Gonapodya sp. JEL0774]|nr:hypothetical protein HDU93_007522 [Gonapodya sp. JEL0774]
MPTAAPTINAAAPTPIPPMAAGERLEPEELGLDRATVGLAVVLDEAVRRVVELVVTRADVDVVFDLVVEEMVEESEEDKRVKEVEVMEESEEAVDEREEAVLDLESVLDDGVILTNVGAAGAALVISVADKDAADDDGEASVERIEVESCN